MPRDLTVEDTEWLYKDPFQLYWFNWEGAVKYGEILLRKYPNSTTEKKNKKYFEESSPEQNIQNNEQFQDIVQRNLFGHSEFQNHDMNMPTKNYESNASKMLQ